MERPKIICLTPVKNEAWIIEKFIMCASLWADYIILSDQSSEDGTREIAKKYPKVIIIENLYRGEYDEWKIRNILIKEARKIKGKNIFIAVDADEVLTPNLFGNLEWEKLFKLPPKISFLLCSLISRSRTTCIAPVISFFAGQSLPQTKCSGPSSSRAKRKFDFILSPPVST